MSVRICDHSTVGLGRSAPFRRPTCTRCPRRSRIENVLRVRRAFHVPAARDGVKEDVEVAKLVTRRIVNAEDCDQICKVLYDHEGVLSLRHLTTALYFMAKKEGVDSLQVEWLAGRIMEDSRRAQWSCTSVANVLQSCVVLKNYSSVDDLVPVALENLIVGEKDIAHKEVVTILACLVELPDSDAKNRARDEVEAAIMGKSTALVMSRGLDGFRLQDMGVLAWFLTELRCHPQTAESVFLHCRDVIGLEKLSIPSLCLVCRMISLQEDSTREDVDEHVDAIVSCLTEHGALAKMQSLKDSSMMLLSLARMIRARSEDDILAGGSIVAGMKWTHAVSACRKANPTIDRVIRGLLDHICSSLQYEPTDVHQGVFSSILYSLSLLQYQSPEMIAVCTRGIEAHKNNLTLRTISTCSWALSVLRYEDKEILENVFVDRIMDGNLLMQARDDQEEFAQSLCMILYSLASLNMFQSSKSRNLLKEIMKVAEESIPYLNMESLPIFGWSIVVAYQEMDMEDGAFGSVMKKWRTSVTENLDHIPKETMGMIHHTEIALRIEAPDMGLKDDIPYQSLFYSLYRRGRLRRSTSREWNSQQPPKLDTVALDGISLFQKQVYRAAEAVLPGWTLEYWDEDLQYPVDMALPSQRLVIEADGPTHFTFNTQRPLGATALKRRLLKRIGWHLITIPFFEWSIQACDREQIEYLSRLLAPYLTSTQHEEPHTTLSGEGAEAPKTDPLPKYGEPVKKNAATMDIIKARRGQMSLNDAVRRQIFRK